MVPQSESNHDSSCRWTSGRLAPCCPEAPLAGPPGQATRATPSCWTPTDGTTEGPPMPPARTSTLRWRCRMRQRALLLLPLLIVIAGCSERQDPTGVLDPPQLNEQAASIPKVEERFTWVFPHLNRPASASVGRSSYSSGFCRSCRGKRRTFSEGVGHSLGTAPREPASGPGPGACQGGPVPCGPRAAAIRGERAGSAVGRATVDLRSADLRCTLSGIRPVHATAEETCHCVTSVFVPPPSLSL
jgi:hypothetical protein